jgi:hypothetical protein
VGYLGITTGAIVALGGSIAAATVKPEAGNVTAQIIRHNRPPKNRADSSLDIQISNA